MTMAMQAQGGYPVENIFSEKGDDQRVAIFYVKPVPDPEKSQAAGYTINVDQVFCRHHEIGDKLTVHDVPATENLKRRYARQWAMFEQGRGEEHVGMDLNLLFPGQPSLVKNLQANGIHVVEELAMISDNAVGQMGMGADRWREKAKKFLAQAKDTAALTQVTAENDKLRAEMDDLREQMKMMTTAMNRVPLPAEEADPTAPRRGRPPKARAAAYPEDEE